ncbi:MAG: hypothetical protein ACD_62C00022G0002 [uncultured bacterium]|nr:MAG: hypothetical protein ACD_62C00022G0002 [uncultured bacterium]
MKQAPIETRTNLIWMDAGIRHDEIKENAMLTLEHAQEVISAYIKSSKGDSVPTLVDYSKLKSMGKDAREFFAGRQCQGVVKAMAIVVGSPVSEITASLFVNLSKPKFPTKIFTNKQEAQVWLKNG